MTTPELEILLTEDGSPTLRTAAGITYHSTHGAVQESEKVFLNNGLAETLEAFPNTDVCVFEMGFGTGLNALLTAIYASQLRRHVRYFSIEKHLVPEPVWTQLRYAHTAEEQAIFQQIHSSEWHRWVEISSFFGLYKIAGALEETSIPEGLHCIYFDAFAPEDHPEAWTEAIFGKLYEALLPGGLLTTYCSKGVVRRALQRVGFRVEKHPGPPGKREIVRAVKD